MQRSGCDGSVLCDANGVDSQAASRRGHKSQKDELVRTIGHGGRLLAPNDIRCPVVEVDGCQNGRRERPRAWREPSVKGRAGAAHRAPRPQPEPATGLFEINAGPSFGARRFPRLTGPSRCRCWSVSFGLHLSYSGCAHLSGVTSRVLVNCA
jgi:hypothetical protein